MEMQQQQQPWKKERVVLVATPFQGHMSPMLQLGSILQSNGFSVTLAHSTFNPPPNPSGYPQFFFLPLPDTVSDVDPDFGSALNFFAALHGNCRPPLHDYLAREKDRIFCVIYDTLMYFVEDVARSLQLPSVVFRSTSALNQLAYIAVGRLEDRGYFPLKESLMQEAVPECDPLRFKDLPVIPAGPSILKILAILRNFGSSSAIIYNTMDWLEKPALSQLNQHYNLPCFTVGPLHKIGTAPSTSFLEEDTTCIEWLDKQAPNSVLYVSFGSSTKVGKDEVAEIAWALANSEHPFLWVVRPGSVSGSEWTELLPEGFKDIIVGKGHIVKWAPQTQVLSHRSVGGFFSHCGWNSTLESICEGVPMICRPGLFDQGVNSRYITHVWRVGIELEGGLERGEIERAITKVMAEEEGDKMRQRAADMKGMVDVCMQEDGSSYNSLKSLKDFILSL